MKKLKRGDKREDGRIYWGSNKGDPTWLDFETFQKYKERSKKYIKNHYLKNPDKKRLEGLQYRLSRPDLFPFAGVGSGNALKTKSNPNGETKEEKRIRRNAERRSKTKTDPMFRIKCACRARLGIAIRKIKSQKPAKTIEIVGCTWEELKSHLESQFKKEMTWKNHGVHGWHIDHIKPLFLAKTTEELMILCHFSNLRPLWGKENIAKGYKF